MMLLQLASLKLIKVFLYAGLIYASEDSLAGPHKFKGLFDGEELVLR